jgi:hypothetical protein
METKITCAAIKLDDGRVFSLPPPNRHNDIIHAIRLTGYSGPVSGPHQGFLNSEESFVSRLEAADIAISAGQCETVMCPNTGLLSQDLW